MMAKKSLFVMVVALLLAPGVARADWLITPWGGGTFGKDAKGLEHLTYGASIGWMGAGVIGAEADFGYTPHFFEPSNSNNTALVGSDNVTSLMANLLVGAPIGGQKGGGLRPYASGGFGLLKSNVPGATDFLKVSNNDWGVNVGFGAVGFVSDHVGIRGDVRYLRSLQTDTSTATNFALGKFDFWRWNVGVTFR